ncbi:pyridoxal phosphate-dependent decarboxylase family protein [Rhizobium sp. G187]|uniref:pyridoxal phosphate-dependent decarboxylase family protein n=1 Tax=Rhizobium sp. G187 TaxID=3451352 RepID=UPI003EE6331F
MTANIVNVKAPVESDRGIDLLAHEILGSALQSLARYRDALLAVAELIGAQQRSGPYAGRHADDLAKDISLIDPMPDEGTGLTRALEDIGRPAVANALNVGSPVTMAHLQCPVSISALAAEAIVAATNQSLDSWDQSPFATMVEEKVCTWLSSLCGLPESAGGSFTSGGTQSNMTALYLATERLGPESRRRGVIFASDQAHFSITKSAEILGFPRGAITLVPTDDEGRMEPEALERAVDQAIANGMIPVTIVATAGTTDLGAIDPLDAISDIAMRRDIWLHVDAAYGAGLLFTRYRGRLSGIEKARSITLDFHKMLFQPISCSAVVLRDVRDFAPLASKADYLNPEEEVFKGVPNLVERSFQTTRRSDALKVLMTTRSLGRSGLSTLLEQTLANTQAIAEEISRHDDWILSRTSSLSTVLFRPKLDCDGERQDRLVMLARAELMHRGIAAVATTVLDGRVHFKLTLLNPASTLDAVRPVLDALSVILKELEAQYAQA